MKKALGFILIVLALLASCSEDDKVINDEPIIGNSELAIKDDIINDELLDNKLVIYNKENIVITLINIEEGRCPINVTCFWEGNTAVEMRISKDNEIVDFTLNTAGEMDDTLPRSITVFDLNITLDDLQPHPIDENMEIPLENYMVGLSVN